jgi:hypothetical protein
MAVVMGIGDSPNPQRDVEGALLAFKKQTEKCPVVIISIEGDANSAQLPGILGCAKTVGFESPHFANVVVDLSALFAANCTRPLTDLRVTTVRVGDLEESESVPYLAGILETQSPDKINTDDANTLAKTVVESLGGNFGKLHDFAELAEGLDAMQAKAEFARLIATEQTWVEMIISLFDSYRFSRHCSWHTRCRWSSSIAPS